MNKGKLRGIHEQILSLLYLLMCSLYYTAHVLGLVELWCCYGGNYFEVIVVLGVVVLAKGVVRCCT